MKLQEKRIGSYSKKETNRTWGSICYEKLKPEINIRILFETDHAKKMKRSLSAKRKFLFALLSALIIGSAIFFVLSSKLSDGLIFAYSNNRSVTIKDRNLNKIIIKPNQSGYYDEYADEVPPLFKKLLLLKEDKYFYYHPGINPISNLRAFLNLLMGNKNLASSTITQQLAKILLKNETERNLKNKIIESIYAVSLEINLNKEDILKMYANSAYFGNNTQGIEEASRLYFDSSPSFLSEAQVLQLLSTISSPSVSNPFKVDSAKNSIALAKRIGEKRIEISPFTEDEIIGKRKKFYGYLKSDSSFELESLGLNCPSNCVLTIDEELNKKLRDILKRNLLAVSDKDVTNGAIVVIKLPENELLSVIGSPDPSLQDFGYQINMAKEPRPIGSTIKPFIYLKAFEKGLRPYTLVEDKEYKYLIGSGFPLYPKNYDYQYRGIVNLHYALSNSLNVPAVIVLENVGLNNFYEFLLGDLHMKPVQDMEKYQLGIALGELETDLLSLSFFFTIFPNEGNLVPLKLYENGNIQSGKLGADFSQNGNVSEKQYVELINKILSDRKTGAEEFGIKSSLNLPQDNFAVKTGTSREFHDSWTIGYTPDFLVGAWVGNSDNSAMDEISGQSGAGAVWNEAMTLMINSEYNKKTPFDFEDIEDFYENDNVEYGLEGDDYEEQKMMLMKNDLILNPHDQDIFLLEKNTQIPLKSKEESEWYVDDKMLGKGKEIIFSPRNYGGYKIEAISFESDKKESLTIYFEKDE